MNSLRHTAREGLGQSALVEHCGSGAWNRVLGAHPQTLFFLLTIFWLLHATPNSLPLGRNWEVGSGSSLVAMYIFICFIHTFSPTPTGTPWSGLCVCTMAIFVLSSLLHICLSLSSPPPPSPPPL